MLRLRDIMTSEVLTLAPDASLRSALELFASRRIGGAPVVAGSRVVGVVSASDILAFASAGMRPPEDPAAPPLPDDEWERPEDEGDAMREERWLEALWTGDVHDASAARDGSPSPDPLEAHTVDEVMTRDVVALPPTASVAAAADLMRTRDVHRILVIADGRLEGIVSTMDLVRAVADRRLARGA